MREKVENEWRNKGGGGNEKKLRREIKMERGKKAM